LQAGECRMKKLSVCLVFAILISLVITGCYGNVDDPDPNLTTLPVQTTSCLPTVSPDHLTALATIDLAQKLDIAGSGIETLFIKPVLWPDTSLGCPEEGKQYAQVITPGYQILLQAGEYVYEYHTDEQNQVVLCGWALAAEVEVPSQEATLEDGGPDQPIGGDVIITYKPQTDLDGMFVDGGPNQPIGTDVVITTKIDLP